MTVTITIQDYNAETGETRMIEKVIEVEDEEADTENNT